MYIVLNRIGDSDSYEVFDNATLKTVTKTHAELLAEHTYGVTKDEVTVYETIENFVNSFNVQQALCGGRGVLHHIVRVGGEPYVEWEITEKEWHDWRCEQEGRCAYPVHADYLRILPESDGIRLGSRITHFDGSRVVLRGVSDIRYLFSHMSELEELVLPYLPCVPHLIVSMCKKLKSVVLRLYDKEHGEPVMVDYEEMGYKLGSSAFYRCESLEHVELDDRITEFYGFVFRGCKSLRTLQLPAELQRIGAMCFAESGLESFVAPSKLEQILSNAFKDCKALKYVELNEGFKSIEQPFTGCTGLERLVIPSTMTRFSGPETCRAGVEIIVRNNPAMYRLFCDCNQKYHRGFIIRQTEV